MLWWIWPPLATAQGRTKIAAPELHTFYKSKLFYIILLSMWTEKIQIWSKGKRLELNLIPILIHPYLRNFIKIQLTLHLAPQFTEIFLYVCLAWATISIRIETPGNAPTPSRHSDRLLYCLKLYPGPVSLPQLWGDISKHFCHPFSGLTWCFVDP